MTKICSTFIFLLFITTIFAQKVKGSRAVTIAPREIASFETIEVDSSFDIFLTFGDQCAIEVEADDNLHEFIKTDIDNGSITNQASVNGTAPNNTVVTDQSGNGSADNDPNIITFCICLHFISFY